MKGHIKSEHLSQTKKQSVIKCFDCEFEADSFQNFKIHIKEHHSKDKKVDDEKFNLCPEVFTSKLELKSTLAVITTKSMMYV